MQIGVIALRKAGPSTCERFCDEALVRFRESDDRVAAVALMGRVWLVVGRRMGAG
jgi:hypothetical protein